MSQKQSKHIRNLEKRIQALEQHINNIGTPAKPPAQTGIINRIKHRLKRL